MAITRTKIKIYGLIIVAITIILPPIKKMILLFWNNTDYLNIRVLKKKKTRTKYSILLQYSNYN